MILHDHPVHSATEWDEDLLNDLPHKMLVWWANECAERALNHVYESGGETDIRSYQAISASRLWCQDLISDKQMKEAADAAYSVARAVARAANADDADDAANAAWAARAANAARVAYAALAARAGYGERRAQISGLQYLVKVWMICGDRSPHLLNDDNKHGAIAGNPRVFQLSGNPLTDGVRIIAIEIVGQDPGDRAIDPELSLYPRGAHDPDA